MWEPGVLPLENYVFLHYCMRVLVYFWLLKWPHNVSIFLTRKCFVLSILFSIPEIIIYNFPSLAPYSFFPPPFPYHLCILYLSFPFSPVKSGRQGVTPVKILKDIYVYLSVNFRVFWVLLTMQRDITTFFYDLWPKIMQSLKRFQLPSYHPTPHAKLFPALHPQ